MSHRRSSLISFCTCVLIRSQLAIALAANIGGQSSPISSPQNLIALQAMDPPIDWSTWFIVAIPVSAISIILIWLLLLLSYRPGRTPDGESNLEIKTIKPVKESFTLKQYWVSFVCLTTIALWCVAHSIQEQVGDMGVIAILPIVAFFSTGVLKKVRGVVVAYEVLAEHFPPGRFRAIHVDHCVPGNGWNRSREGRHVKRSFGSHGRIDPRPR